jgi:DNA modification methylase
VTPYYQDDLVTIYHGDALALLSEMPESDLLLTDPPYNVGVSYGRHNDRQDSDVYAAWCRLWFDAAAAITKRQVLFPGHGNLPVWWQGRMPSAVGCWYKPGALKNGHLGWEEWEPYLYWGKRCSGSSVVKASLTVQSDTGGHPCPKSLSLMRLLVGKFQPGSVLDPFLGSGTTALAAKGLGIPSIGIEIDERYCEIAATRCSQEVLGLPA